MLFALLLFFDINAQTEVHPYLLASVSSKQVRGSILYSKNHMEFADLDGDGNEEFIGIERASELSLGMRVVISRRHNEGWQILWQSEKVYSKRSVLVGNVDQDPLPELIVFGSRSNNSSEATVRVIEWQDNAFETSSATTQYSGTLGSLADIDDDGSNEILLTPLRTAKLYSEISGVEPAELIVLRLIKNRFVQISSLDLPDGVQALATADIDADGEVEVFTYGIGEKLSDLHSFARKQRLHGLVKVHSIDPDRGFRNLVLGHAISVPNDLTTPLPYLNFIGIFSCAEDYYLFIETDTRMWKSYLKLSMDDDSALTWDTIGSDSFEVFEMARRLTMAYSGEQKAYVHAIDSSQIEFIPQEAIHTPYTDRKCDKSQKGE